MYTVLVVDDESLIRKSLVTKLKKSKYSFKTIIEAQNVKDAIQYTNIDILITDIRMGNSTGLELAEYMKKNNPQLKTIIISGHREFSYATKALSLGVIDYLVKPINTEELLLSIAKAIMLIDQEEEDKTSQDKAQIEEVSANLTSLFLKHEPLRTQDLAPYLGIPQAVCFMSLQLFIASPNENILYIVKHCIQESSFTFGYDIATYKGKLRQVGLIIAFSKKYSLKGSLPAAVNDLILIMREDLELRGMKDYTIGISRFTEDAMVCYEQSLEAMSHRIVFPTDSVISYDTCSEITESYVLSKEAKTKFLLLLSTQCVPSLELFIADLVQDLERRMPVRYYSLQLLFNYFIEMISITLHDHPSSLAFSREPYQFNSIREMADHLRGYCLRAIDLSDLATNESRMVQLVNRLQSLIKEHCDQKLTLEMYCDQNNVNTSFFSNQFHKVAGITFQEYLNNTRIDNAKRLLTETDNRIGTIATMCGFSNPHYFSKTFKRLTGVTPKEYQVQSGVKGNNSKT